MNWKDILYSIYDPEVGSIWAAPNGIWTNTFASNKLKTDYHPSVVGKLSSCKTNCQIIPGTSKDYRKGSCVYTLRLKPTDIGCSESYFLIDLWMTFNKSDLLTLNKGWNGVENLNETQLKEFKLQIKFCKGIDV
jgi:hypothetical protein